MSSTRSSTIGLQPEAGRALPAVAEANRERIAGAQIAAADADEQRVRVGADVEPVEPDLELGAVARLDRGEVRRRGLSNCGLLMSEVVRHEIFTMPVSSMPNVPAV